MQLGAFTSTGWNRKEYHLVLEDGHCYLTILHDDKYCAPIASMSEETWKKILWSVENPDEVQP